MKILILVGMLLGSQFALATSELKDHCDTDPSGELYSEIWDATADQALKSIGLNPDNYKKLLSTLEFDTFFHLARLTKESHPEIANAPRPPRTFGTASLKLTPWDSARAGHRNFVK